MTVTTSKNKPQHRKSTAKSLSDLEHLLHQTNTSFPTSSTTATATTETTTMNMNQTQDQAASNVRASTQAASAQAKENLNDLGAALAAKLNSPSAENAEAESIAAMLTGLFGTMIDEMQAQTNQSIDAIGEHLKQAILPLTEQVGQCINETAEVKKDVVGMRAELDQLKKNLDAKTNPEPAKEASRVMRAAAVVKDVGAYSGAAILVGIVGKAAFDVFKRKDSAEA